MPHLVSCAVAVLMRHNILRCEHPMSSGLRHLVFLHRLNVIQRDAVDWHSLALCFRILTRFDAWAGGASSEEWLDGDERAAELNSLARTELSLQPSLCELAGIIASREPTPAARARAAESLLELSTCFRARCRYDLMLDLAETALEHAGHNLDVQWRAHVACGWAHRILGNPDQADLHYQNCIEIGTSLDDAEAVFRGLSGMTMTTRGRGNLPRAEASAESLVAWTVRLERPDFESLARHTLGVILGLQGKHVDSIAEFQKALSTCAPSERERVLLDLAFARAQLGFVVEARDTFIRILKSTSDQHCAVIARINLIQVYGALRDRMALEAQREVLDSMSLPASVTTDFQLTLGLAYLGLEELELALPRFECARAVAQDAKMGQAIIEADEYIERAKRGFGKPNDGVHTRTMSSSGPFSSVHRAHLAFFTPRQ
jgi:tetratricopeptide (TPR) repeat protein